MRADTGVAMAGNELVTHIRRGRIDRDGEQLFFEFFHRDDDARPVVVLTHGAGGSHAVWFNQVPALADRFRVLTWDSRGFGNSTCRSGRLSVDAAVADLDAILTEVAVDEPVHLVGQSMGGWWTTGFALAHPARVRTLVLSDTPGGIWTPALREHFAAFQRAGGLRSGDVVSRHGALGATTQRTQPTSTFLYQQLGSFHEPPMAEVGRLVAGTGFPADVVKDLGPVLAVIAGEEDHIFPPRLLAELAGLIGATYVELPAAGHSPYFETPAAYNAALLGLLG
jgi:3-oxoadipate enol-lactonase